MDYIDNEDTSSIAIKEEVRKQKNLKKNKAIFDAVFTILYLILVAYFSINTYYSNNYNNHEVLARFVISFVSSFGLSLGTLALPYFIFKRILFGKLNPFSSDVSLILFPLIIFGIILNFMFDFLRYYKDNFLFQPLIEVSLAIIISFIITRKIYFYIFKKQDSND